MNPDLRKKIPKEITVHGVKGSLHRAGTYYTPDGFRTYIEYVFETKKLHEKLGIGKKVAVECYTTVNDGEINFGRSVEEKHFKKEKK